MDTDTIEEQATAALDAILPRRDPRYGRAQVYLMVYLGTDPATRRLAMRALKAASPDGTETITAAPPSAAAPESSGEVHDGAAAPRAVGVAASSEIAQTRGRDSAGAHDPAGSQSGQPRLWCHGKACEEKGGVEIHRDDPSCGHLHPPKRARA